MPYWEYLEENWCTQNWHIIFTSVFLRSQKNKSKAQHQDIIKIYNGCSLNACCRHGNWILFTEYFYTSKAITWEIWVAAFCSVPQQFCKFMTLAREKSSTSVLPGRENQLNLKRTHTLLTKKYLFQIWGQDTQPAPNNLRNRLAKTIDQFIQILDLFPQKPLH